MIPAVNVCREATSCCERVWIVLLGLCMIEAPGAIWRRALGQGLEELHELLGLASALHSCSLKLMVSGPCLLHGES